MEPSLKTGSISIARILFFEDYDERSALTIFNRAACTAGKNPPANPIKRENKSDVKTIEGDSANENCSSENDW